MKYFSMFSGIGGFEIGIEKAIKKSKCVGFSEIDKHAIQIYQKHFPGHTPYGDAKRIVPESIPNFDLLCGGFPCQAFSIAGRRGGFEDTRGTLFYEIARIARIKRPKLLFLENVKGLLSHDHGRTFGTILATFSDLGYFLEWQILNSADFGVPQNRERVFIVGHLGNRSGRKVFPVTKDNGKINELQGQPIANCLKARYEANGDGSYVIESKLDAQKAVRAPLRFLDRNQKKFEGDYSFTVDSSNTSGIKVNQRIRRLTPTECERLQAFPDGWTAGISDSQRYKCLGNAVTVNVIEAIARRLYNLQTIN